MLHRPTTARRWLILALLVAVALEAATIPLMDPIVATRFALDGSATGTLTREVYAALIIGSTIVTACLAALTAGGIRSGALVDLPATDRLVYLSDAMRAQTTALLDRHGLRAAGVVLVFCTGLHAFIYHANRATPASLWTPGLVGWIVLFVAMLIACARSARKDLKPFALRTLS